MSVYSKGEESVVTLFIRDSKLFVLISSIRLPGAARRVYFECAKPLLSQGESENKFLKLPACHQTI